MTAVSMLDILVFVVLVCGFIRGAMDGFFRQAASITGFFAGLLVAFMLYPVVGDWLAVHFEGGLSVARVIAFVLLWLAVPIVLSLLADVLARAVRIAGLGGLDRLGGAVLGGLKYVIFFSCLLNVAAMFRILPSGVEESSRLCGPVRSVSSRLFEVCKSQVVRMTQDVMTDMD